MKLKNPATKAQLDMMSKKCRTCRKGVYRETSLMDDMHGILHCTKCDAVTERYLPSGGVNLKKEAAAAKSKPRTKRTLKLGNDGYGCKNVTVKAVPTGHIEFTRTDPHDWGRISDQFYIRKEDIKQLATFLLNQIEA